MTVKHILVRRVMPVLMAVVMCMSLLVPVASASTKGQITNLKKEATSLNVKKNELKQQLASLGSDKSKAIEKKELLDSQCEVIRGEISNISAQIDKYSNLITETEAEIVETEAKEEEQYELFCKRVRAMEENGSVSYWEVIFKATDFADLLSRIDFINEIMDYDKRVMDELRALREKLADQKETLEDSKAEQVEAKKELDARKAELDSQLNEATSLVKEIRSQESEYQHALDAYEQEEEDIQKKIVELSRKQAEEDAARAEAEKNQNNGGGSSNGGSHSSGGGGGGNTGPASSSGYIWPVSSHTVTSPFGPRKSPGGIGSRYHKGIDIGGVGYSSTVHAAKAGTVIVSQNSRSYGNYVVISHGSGNTTLYAHMSSRSVSAGQRVQQGQAIGVTGSTGNSTGPHLHFEVTVGGSRVNPMNYLP